MYNHCYKNGYEGNIEKVLSYFLYKRGESEVDLNRVEHDGLKKELKGLNIEDLLGVYHRESKRFEDKCSNFVEVYVSLNENGLREFREDCRLSEESKILVALEIADRMVKTE